MLLVSKPDARPLKLMTVDVVMMNFLHSKEHQTNKKTPLQSRNDLLSKERLARERRLC